MLTIIKKKHIIYREKNSLKYRLQKTHVMYLAGTQY